MESAANPPRGATSPERLTARSIRTEYNVEPYETNQVSLFPASLDFPTMTPSDGPAFDGDTCY